MDCSSDTLCTNLAGWRTDRRPWGVGNDGRMGNLLKKTPFERCDISQTRRIYFSNRRWTNQSLWRRSRLDNIHLDTSAINSRWKSCWYSWTFVDDGEAINDFLVHVRKLQRPPSRWTYGQTLHTESGIITYATKIDVSRTTHTNLDVEQKRPIDDYWNIDGSRDLSDPWTGFTQFTFGRKTYRRLSLVRGEIKKETAYI